MFKLAVSPDVSHSLRSKKSEKTDFDQDVNDIHDDELDAKTESDESKSVGDDDKSEFESELESVPESKEVYISSVAPPNYQFKVCY